MVLSRSYFKINKGIFVCSLSIFLDEIMKENQLIIYRAYEIMGHIHDTKYGLHMHIYYFFHME